MRFSPTRILLAALAFIVGAVLALPMLLSRKAEAGDAPPNLEAPKREAERGGGWSIAASTEAVAALGSNADGDHGEVCGEARTDAWSHDVAGPHAIGPLPALDWLRAPHERSSHEVAAEPPAGPWPPAQAMDRQRKYHLRP